MSKKSFLLESFEHLVQKAPNRQPDASDTIESIYSAVNRYFPSRHSHRMLVNALVELVFNRAIELIAIGQYPSAYIELHALLEDIAIVLLGKQISVKGHQKMVADILKRKTLSDIAPYYKDLGYWSQSDVAFVKKLAGIRNGVAHRNFDLLAKHLPSKKEDRDLDSFHFDLSKTVETFARVVSLTVQISRPHKRAYRGWRVAN